jgi:hypothetical protein
MTETPTETPTETEKRQAAAEAKVEALEKMKKHYVEVLMNQTTWSADEAREKLEANGYNVQLCVRLFMGLSPTAEAPTVKPKTVNQGIYNHIRGMMDDASRRYERKKAMEARIEAAKEAYVRSNQKSDNDT